jgi:SAM-dependent methyltransferase
MQTSIGLEIGKILSEDRIEDAEAVAADLLNDVLSEDGWLELLSTWCSAGCGALDTDRPELGLGKGSWDRFHRRLADTGWFVVGGGRIRPNGEGRDLLARANELHRAILRDDRDDRVVAQAIDAVPRGAAVDIGCGSGHSVLRLAKLGFGPLFAYDLSPIAMGMAKALIDHEGKSAHLFTREATGLKEIGSESLSLVFSRGALHYFNQRALAQTLKRTLKPGGYVVAELVALGYYLQRSHVKRLASNRWWQPLSYARTVFRTWIFELATIQPRLAAGAPEIGYTIRSINRLARCAELRVESISKAPTSVGYLVVLRKPRIDER